MSRSHVTPRPKVRRRPTWSAQEKVALVLFAIGIGLANIGLLGLAGDEQSSNVALALSALALALATFVYGLLRRYFQLTLSTALAYVVLAVTYLLPKHQDIAWIGQVAHGVLLVTVLAWLRWVAFGKSRVGG